MAILKDEQRRKDKKSSKKKRKRNPSPQVSEARSIFGRELENINALLARRENDGAITLAQKAMLETTLSLIPLLEEAYKEKGADRTIYAFNNSISTVRELLADLQANSDRRQVLDNIIYNILEPSLMSFANFIVDSNYSLKKELQDIVPRKERRYLDSKINDISKANASYVKELFNSLRERITDGLAE